MQIHEILIIKNGVESYGIPTENINQISRVPLLMPLPLRPKSVRGLCAVSGNIVSLLDFNSLLGMKEVDYNDNKSRLLSLNHEHSSNALLVSEVYDTVVINQDNVEYLNQENNPVMGVYKYEDMLIQIMSLDVLVSRIHKVEIASDEVKNGKVGELVATEEESNRFLIFSLARETFALNIEYLQEIILADIQITEINGSEKEVLGLITLRDELIVVIDLRVYYGFESSRSEKNRILIASYNGKRIGLLIDNIVDIENFISSSVEYMSEALDKNIAGVIHAKDSLISFFDHNALEDIFKKNDSFVDESVANLEEEGSDDAMEVIVFKLSDKEYAFEVESVDEIIDAVEATDIAFTDDTVSGIINIRGQIVTLISLFEKLKLDAKIHEDSKIIVCNINNIRIGFTVDSVSDILHIKESEIRKEDDELFSSILYLENGNRLVMTMDINNIITIED